MKMTPYRWFCLLTSFASGLAAQTLSLEARVTGRSYPSVFQAWSPADNLPGEDRLTTLARHDLVLCSANLLRLRWDNSHPGLARGFETTGIPGALQMRRELLNRNPHMVFLLEIRYRDAPRNYLPEGHAWWKRDPAGNIEKGWAEGGFLKLDFAGLEFRKQVAAQAAAAVSSGVFDGVMLDWWNDDDDRLALVREVRAAIGETALILANANDRKTPRTAPYVNGYFMECTRTRDAADWERIANTLAWAEANLRQPRINCLETWYHESRDDLNLMRATTALSLVLSNGYVLFSDPNPLPKPDHLHNWYPFWEKALGRPVAQGMKNADGAVHREFERGTVVYNPFGNAPGTISFDAPRQSAATGVVSSSHALEQGDGGIYLK